MQARVLALALCLSYVSVSLTSRCSVETAVFGKGASFLLSCTVKRKFAYLQKHGNLSKTPDLENFASAYIDHRNVLST